VRIAVAATRAGRAELVDPEGDLRLEVDRDALPAEIARLEATSGPRWVWSDTREWAPVLLAAGVRVARCHDLRLSGAILAGSTLVDEAARRDAPRPPWLPAGPAEAVIPGLQAPAPSVDRGPALFDFEAESDATEGAVGMPPADALVAEHDRQLGLVAASARPGALRLLLAAESAGALIAAELQSAGLPWDRETHERVLHDALGPRPVQGRKPARMEQLAGSVRVELEAPGLNLDSQVDLLRALRSAGIAVDSTARWELREHDHPAIAPLIAYKRLSRLLSANGWGWLDEWIVDGRFRADYVAGGTATGRWATAGGGALQLP
jgi:DNA polymerase-1